MWTDHFVPFLASHLKRNPTQSYLRSLICSFNTLRVKKFHNFQTKFQKKEENFKENENSNWIEWNTDCWRCWFGGCRWWFVAGNRRLNRDRTRANDRSRRRWTERNSAAAGRSCTYPEAASYLQSFPPIENSIQELIQYKLSWFHPTGTGASNQQSHQFNNQINSNFFTRKTYGWLKKNMKNDIEFVETDEYGIETIQPDFPKVRRWGVIGEEFREVHQDRFAATDISAVVG